MGIPEDDLVGGRWVMKDKIDSWCAGDVYAATEMDDSGSFLVKLESRAPENNALRQEFTSYKKVGAFRKEVKGFATVHFYGKHGEYNALVLDGVTTTLSTVIDLHPRITYQMTISIGIQALNCLEDLHCVGVIHGNVNPGNIRFMNEDLYLFNLEHSASIRSQYSLERTRLSKRENRNPYDILFAPQSWHAGFSASYRDDLESLGYVLVYTFNRSLPWEEFDSKSEEKKMHELKHRISASELCEGMTEEMVEYFKAVRSLEYSERADYSMLRELFRGALEERKVVEKEKFNTSCLEKHRAQRERVCRKGSAVKGEERTSSSDYKSVSCSSSSSSSVSSHTAGNSTSSHEDWTSVNGVDNGVCFDESETKLESMAPGQGDEDENGQTAVGAANSANPSGEQAAVVTASGWPQASEDTDELDGGKARAWHLLSDFQRWTLAERQGGRIRSSRPTTVMSDEVGGGRLSGAVRAGDEAKVRWAKREYDKLLRNR